MKLKTIAYGIYMALSILFSITVAIVPAIAAVLTAYENLDSIFASFGGLFTGFEQWVSDVFGWFLPQIVFDKFWFILFFPTLAFICYGIFLAILAIMFRFSRKVIETVLIAGLSSSLRSFSPSPQYSQPAAVIRLRSGMVNIVWRIWRRSTPR